jgi:hypothetical protein
MYELERTGARHPGRKVLIPSRKEICAVENPPYIKANHLKVTPAIILMQDGTVREPSGEVDHPGPLKRIQKKTYCR